LTLAYIFIIAYAATFAAIFFGILVFTQPIAFIDAFVIMFFRLAVFVELVVFVGLAAVGGVFVLAELVR